MRAENKKSQVEMTKSKTFVVEIKKTFLKDLTNSEAAAEEVSELKIICTSRQQQKKERVLK